MFEDGIYLPYDVQAYLLEEAIEWERRGHHDCAAIVLAEAIAEGEA